MSIKGRSKLLKINLKRLRQERKLHPEVQKITPKYKPVKRIPSEGK